MLSAALPEHADKLSAPTNDSTAAATIPRLPTAIALPPSGVALTRRSSGPAGGRPGTWRRLLGRRLGGQRRHLVRLGVLDLFSGLGWLAAVEDPSSMGADQLGA